MFVVRDFSNGSSRNYEVYDGKEVGDIIVGITGSEEDGERISSLVSNMKFNETVIHPGSFMIYCQKA